MPGARPREAIKYGPRSAATRAPQQRALTAPGAFRDQVNAADARPEPAIRARPPRIAAARTPRRRRGADDKTTMLRALSPRRKFSFDLALHRSKEKKRKDSLDDAAFAAMVDETLGSSERPARSKSRVARAASFFQERFLSREVRLQGLFIISTSF